MHSFRVRWKSLGLLTVSLAVIALGLATRSEPAKALSCVNRSARIRLINVTEDGAAVPGNHNGLVVLFGREPGVVEVTSRPESEPTAIWVESYHVATPSP